MPCYGERGAQFAPQPGVEAAAAPRRLSHILYIVEEPPRSVTPVHIVNVCETVFTTALYRIVVREERVQPEPGTAIRQD